MIGLFFTFVISACGSKLQIDEQSIINDPPPGPFAIDGKALWNERCKSCHGTLELTDKKDRTPEQIQLSIQQISSMKTLSNLTSLTDAQIKAISEALQTEQTNEEFASRKLLLGTRTYVSSLFRTLFMTTGSETAINAKILDLIDRQPASFGGPCVPYEGGAACPGDRLINRNAPVLPLPSVTRRGFFIRACQEILSIDVAVTNVLGKVGLNTASVATSQNIDKLVNLFTPGRMVDGETIGSLIQIHMMAKTQSLSDLEAWRFTVLSLCSAITLELL